MKKQLRRIGRISYRTWLILFIVSGLVCVFALRHNNQEMVKLRSAVYAADKDNGDVNAALNSLRGYVYSHMNTDLSAGNNIKPPIQLQYTYQRLYDAQFNQVEAQNQAIYSTAQKVCPANAAGYDPVRLACIENYAVNHGVKSANINIPSGLYEFDFISPTWSPDLAGWSLLATIILFLAFAVRFAVAKFDHQKYPPR